MDESPFQRICQYLEPRFVVNAFDKFSEMEIRPQCWTSGIRLFQIQYHAFSFWIVGIDFVFFMTKDSKFNTMRLGLLGLTSEACIIWDESSFWTIRPMF